MERSKFLRIGVKSGLAVAAAGTLGIAPWAQEAPPADKLEAWIARHRGKALSRPGAYTCKLQPNPARLQDSFEQLNRIFESSLRCNGSTVSGRYQGRNVKIRILAA